MVYTECKWTLMLLNFYSYNRLYWTNKLESSKLCLKNSWHDWREQSEINDMHNLWKWWKCEFTKVMDNYTSQYHFWGHGCKGRIHEKQLDKNQRIKDTGLCRLMQQASSKPENPSPMWEMDWSGHRKLRHQTSDTKHFLLFFGKRFWHWWGLKRQK